MCFISRSFTCDFITEYTRSLPAVMLPLIMSALFHCGFYRVTAVSFPHTVTLQGTMKSSQYFTVSYRPVRSVEVSTRWVWEGSFPPVRRVAGSPREIFWSRKRRILKKNTVNNIYGTFGIWENSSEPIGLNSYAPAIEERIGNVYNAE